MAKITWTDKVTIDPRPDIPAANKLTADDINEVKTSVNAAYDEIDALEVDHAALEVDFTNHKINVSNPHEVTAAQLPDLQAKIDATTDPILADLSALDLSKVDKVTGQRLMTDAEGAKLQGIEAGAEVNTVDPIDLADLAADYNAKLDLKVDKVTGQRLMSNAEGTKLAGIEAGAQVNTVFPTDITTLQSNIDAEATTRGNADTTLQGNIDAEETARIAADTTLQTNIDSEAATRSATDITLQNNIDAEALARDAADVALQEDIDTRQPIDGLQVSTMPTTITAGDWYTIARQSVPGVGGASINLTEIEYMSSGSAEASLFRMLIGDAVRSNPFINILGKTHYGTADLDIDGFRILKPIAATGEPIVFYFQAKFSDTKTKARNFIVRSVLNPNGATNPFVLLETPIVQNTITNFETSTTMVVSGGVDTQQTGNHYVLNDKRVLNTDDAATFEPIISKNTAFNKNFGTAAGTVKEGNWVPGWADVTGKPLTFTPNLNSTFTNVQDTVVNTDDSVDLTMGNIFYATATADTVFAMSLTGTQNKQCRLIVDIGGGAVGSITFSGTGVKSHVEPPSGGGFYAEGCTLQFDITIIGTSIFVNMVGGEMT